MRGTQAKALRRRVYGEGGSSRIRAYYTPDGREYRPADYSYPVTDHKGRVLGEAKRLWMAGETVVADTQRQVYQRAKRGHAVGQLFGRWLTAEPGGEPFRVFRYSKKKPAYHITITQ